jgi:hypothetical protein
MKKVFLILALFLGFLATTSSLTIAYADFADPQSVDVGSAETQATSDEVPGFIKVAEAKDHYCTRIGSDQPMTLSFCRIACPPYNGSCLKLPASR